MFDSDISNDSYAPEKLRDPRILAFMRKITVKEDPAFVALRGNAPAARVTAILDDGRRLVQQVENMPGFPGEPMSRADVERKFHSNVGKRWPREGTDDVLKKLWALDETEDLPLLLGRLSVQAS
jgi:2-methylcitrate dehydratase